MIITFISLIFLGIWTGFLMLFNFTTKGVTSTIKELWNEIMKGL